MTTTERANTISKAELRQFTGSEQWFRHGLVRKVLYTEGAQYVAERAGAYWLLDEIAFAQFEPIVAPEEFQLWRLKVSPDKTATLTCENGNDRAVFTKQLEFTDFPLDELVLYYTNNVIFLPSEY
jgi:hypothetical protein